MNWTQNSSYGCQRRQSWLGRKGREVWRNKKSHTKGIWEYLGYLGFTRVISTPRLLEPQLPFIFEDDKFKHSNQPEGNTVLQFCLHSCWTTSRQCICCRHEKLNLFKPLGISDIIYIFPELTKRITHFLWFQLKICFRSFSNPVGSNTRTWLCSLECVNTGLRVGSGQTDNIGKAWVSKFNSCWAT